MKRVFYAVITATAAGTIIYLALSDYRLRARLAQLEDALGEDQRQAAAQQVDLEALRSRQARTIVRLPGPVFQAPVRPNVESDLNPTTEVPSEPPPLESQSTPATVVTSGAAVVLAPAVAVPTIGWVHYITQPGGHCTVRGTSNIGDWEMETVVLSGNLDIDPRYDFRQLEPRRTVPTNLPCAATVNIPVRSLKSGKPSMDEISQSALELRRFPTIVYQLKELAFTGVATNSVLGFSAVGDLLVHGRTNQITMPVLIQTGSDGQISVAGTTPVQMSDFGITPPQPRLAMGLVRTGNEVNLLFTWKLKRAGFLARN